jgi:multiple sugar transport system ATP-binding protein
MASIELRAVNKNYLDNIAVIRNVDLQVKQGEFCVFVGPSGCGKSRCYACSRDWKTSPAATC